MLLNSITCTYFRHNEDGSFLRVDRSVPRSNRDENMCVILAQPNKSYYCVVRAVLLGIVHTVKKNAYGETTELTWQRKSTNVQVDGYLMAGIK